MRDALPYYSTRYSNSLADRMVNAFQFAHTQDRSFGLTIHTPVLPKPIEYTQLAFNLEEQSVEPIAPLAPTERRIMERVVRGLIATKNAVKQTSIESLVNSYQSGFSSNMCKAIVDISRNKAATVEYSVLWSPKIPPPEDLANVPPLLLNETDYAYLESASRQLRNLEPQDTFLVRGLVYGVSSSDDPSIPEAGRSVVVEWEKPDTGRIVKIIVSLSTSDYMQAVEAHRIWYPIEVVGEAKLMGDRWHLLNARDFRVVPSGE